MGTISPRKGGPHGAVPTPHYPLEFKRVVVKLYRSSEKSIPRMAEELGIAGESLRRWIRQHEVDAGEHDRPTTSECEESSKLRRENKTLRQEREFLRKPRRLLCEKGRGSVSVLGLIEAEKSSFPIQLLRRVLGVSRSGYRDWRGSPPSRRSFEGGALAKKIREMH